MRRLMAYLLCLLVLVACQSDPTPTPIPPTPTPSPAEWLARATAAWGTTRSFHFVVATAGRTVPLDPTGSLNFAQAEGDVIAPDRLQARVLVKTPLGNANVRYITIGTRQWLTNPLNDQWQEAPEGMEVAVADLFNQEVGIGALLNEIQNPEVLGTDTIGETTVLHLRGALPGSALAPLAPDLATLEQVTVDLWMGQTDHRIRRVLLTEPARNGVMPNWNFLFSDFDNTTLTIEPPQ